MEFLKLFLFLKDLINFNKHFNKVLTAITLLSYTDGALLSLEHMGLKIQNIKWILKLIGIKK